MVDQELDEAYCKPFEYKHLGSLAYIGNAGELSSSKYKIQLRWLIDIRVRLRPKAVFDLPGYSLSGGLAAMYAWRVDIGGRSKFLREDVSDESEASMKMQTDLESTIVAFTREARFLRLVVSV